MKTCKKSRYVSRQANDLAGTRYYQKEAVRFKSKTAILDYRRTVATKNTKHIIDVQNPCRPMGHNFGDHPATAT